MQALFVGLAALMGILLGFWLRSADVGAEKNLLQQRNRELEDGLAAARDELGKVRAESSSRAGFEALAQEREKTLAQMAAEHDKLRAEMQAKADAEKAQAARVGELEASLRNEREKSAEKTAVFEEARQALANHFEVLAGEILEKKSKSLAEGSQNELGNLLAPLREQIKDFREKVEKVQIDSNTGVTRLETLIGTLGSMNQQLSEEARNLTTALRGSAKAQGDWGEVILLDLLEKAGLRQGEQYSFQESFSAADGDGSEKKSQRTDVIVYLPGNRHLVIDSKVSLTAYTEYVNAVDDEGRKSALKQHLASVRGHLNGLAKASYHRLPGLESPDFVVMFVPVEPAFLTALQSDDALWADGYAQNVLLVGPTTLLYVIRIVNVLWQQETQSRNVKEVMDRGARLYEKFVGFVGDMEAIGSSLHDASQSYEAARKKLSVGDGNLIRQVEMLRQLGVKPRKTLPQSALDSAELDFPVLEIAAEGAEATEPEEAMAQGD
ncbi:MAG TPA: DNA recombination protein RmuC [Terracidiphilus sp.]|nr:DNA recombination protein RmuC [Terracidiphilus sp.]